MRISHKKRKPEPAKLYFFNEGITAPQVLVLDETGANLGVMTAGQAIRRAQERELDLVEINPKTNPPVARIMDFGQFKYQQEKEMRLRKAHQHVVEVKGIRLSLRIGAHDLEIRQNHAARFLNEGNKVKVEIILKGRDFAQIPAAKEVIKKFVANVGAIVPVKYEQEVEKQVNKLTAIIAKI